MKGSNRKLKSFRTMKKTKKRAQARIRNHVVLHPLMRKGGVHRKTNKAQRAKAKRQLKGQQLGPLGDQALNKCA